jgi:hypothetical protein
VTATKWAAILAGCFGLSMTQGPAITKRFLLPRSVFQRPALVSKALRLSTLSPAERATSRDMEAS